MKSTTSRRTLLALGLCVVLAGIVTVGIAAGGPSAESASTATAAAPDAPSQSVAVQDGVSEAAFAEPVPEEGDPYYEAAASDGSWISYINPRDEYRTPYLGEGSGQFCVTLVNENGDPVAGESVPDTTVSMPAGDELEWHDEADPFTVEYPLTDNYARPLDADQFGTTSELPQGDGYLDSHCLAWHGLPENETVEYGEVEVEGDHADDIDVVGYIQQAHDTWDTDVDPIDDAESYEDAGGEWTYHPDGSHGQVVVVLQLDGDELEPADDGLEGDESESESESTEPGDDTAETDAETASDDTTDDAESMPGFGVLVALAALSVAVLERTRRSDR